MMFCFLLSAIRRAVRERILYPIAGRVLDRGLRWVRDQDGWEGVVSAAAHAAIKQSGAVGTRTAVGEVVSRLGSYLSQESFEVLQRIDDIAQKHSPEAN